MSQRHRTGDSDSHAIDARSGLTRRQWLTRAAGAAAGVGLGPPRRPRAGSRVRAGRAQARRHAEGGHRRQAGQHGPGLRPALLVAAGLPERLQQAGQRGRGGPVRSRPGEILEAGERPDLALRPRRQRRLPQRRAAHVQGRGLHVHPAARSQEQAAHAHLLHAGGRRGGGRPVPGALHAVQAVRAAAGHALAGHRSGEREGAQRQGPQALPDRHRTVQVRGVGQGRPHHARALGQVLPPGPALHGQDHLLRARRRHGAAHRPSDRPLQLDPDRAAAAHPRAGARARSRRPRPAGRTCPST